MAVPKSIQSAKGLWHGKSKLNLPWLSPEKRISESVSSLHVDTDPQHKIATITYTWQYEGKREEGTMILAMAPKSKAFEIGWVDSWHESEAVLHLKGEGSDTGPLKAKGQYAAGKEMWGWTIAIDASADHLTIKMENVTPSGEATWAVDGTYTRG